MKISKFLVATMVITLSAGAAQAERPRDAFNDPSRQAGGQKQVTLFDLLFGRNKGNKNQKRQQQQQQPARNNGDNGASFLFGGFRNTELVDCRGPIHVRISKRRQHAQIFEDCKLTKVAGVTTAADGYVTPDFRGYSNGHLGGIETQSASYPDNGCYYNGRHMGNMAFGVFFTPPGAGGPGKFAIHGTCARKNLGNTKTRPYAGSHGCVRIHPSVAEMLNAMAKQVGARGVAIDIAHDFADWDVYSSGGSTGGSRNISPQAEEAIRNGSGGLF